MVRLGKEAEQGRPGRPGREVITDPHYRARSTNTNLNFLSPHKPIIMRDLRVAHRTVAK